MPYLINPNYLFVFGNSQNICLLKDNTTGPYVSTNSDGSFILNPKAATFVPDTNAQSQPIEGVSSTPYQQVLSISPLKK